MRLDGSKARTKQATKEQVQELKQHAYIRLLAGSFQAPFLRVRFYTHESMW